MIRIIKSLKDKILPCYTTIKRIFSDSPSWTFTTDYIKIKFFKRNPLAFNPIFTIFFSTKWPEPLQHTYNIYICILINHIISKKSFTN